MTVAQHISIQQLHWLRHIVCLEEDVPASQVLVLAEVTTMSTLEVPNGGNYFIGRCFQLKKACVDEKHLEGNIKQPEI